MSSQQWTAFPLFTNPVISLAHPMWHETRENLINAFVFSSSFGKSPLLWPRLLCKISGVEKCFYAKLDRLTYFFIVFLFRGIFLQCRWQGTNCCWFLINYILNSRRFCTLKVSTTKRSIILPKSISCWWQCKNWSSIGIFGALSMNFRVAFIWSRTVANTKYSLELFLWAN